MISNLHILYLKILLIMDQLDFFIFYLQHQLFHFHPIIQVILYDEILLLIFTNHLHYLNLNILFLLNSLLKSYIIILIYTLLFYNLSAPHHTISMIALSIFEILTSIPFTITNNNKLIIITRYFNFKIELYIYIFIYYSFIFHLFWI